MSVDVSFCEKTKIISTPEDDFIPHSGGLGCALYEAMHENLENIAQIDGLTGETDTFASFLSRCIQTAHFLVKNGIKPDDVVSICSFNHLNSAVPFVATLLVGAKIASFDPTMSKSEIKFLIKLVNPKIIFASEEVENLLEEIIEHPNTSLVIFGKSERNKKFSEIIETKFEEFQPEPCKDVMDTALIVFSSGTTGLPKGICISHNMMLSLTNFKYKGVSVTFASLYWSSTISNTLATIISGSTRVVCPPFNPKLAWEVIDRCKVTMAFFSPSDVIQFYRNKTEEIIDNTSLVALVIGGSHISHEYVMKLRQTFPNTAVFLSYGQTEVIPAVNGMHPIVFSKPNCVGIPIPGRNYKIVDPETEEPLGFNQKGELRIKTKICMNGYYNQDSSDAWDSDGFLKTGDIAYYDEDFCFFIVDRIKEMFKFRSFHIVPTELENILMSHPDVKFAIVVGIPNEEDDNHALAVIEPIENAKSSPEEIQRFLEEQVDDRHKLRAGVKFIEKMPFTPSNKINRRAVRDMFINKV